MTERLICQSCKQNKAQLSRVASKLIPTMQLNICKMCIQKKYEPRFIIILAANSHGITDELREYINKHRYHGEEISAQEIFS